MKKDKYRLVEGGKQQITYQLIGEGDEMLGIFFSDQKEIAELVVRLLNADAFDAAYAKGCVILDWLDPSMMRTRFEGTTASDEELLDVASRVQVGDWDECVDRDATQELILAASREAGVDLYAGAEVEEG